MSNPWQLDVELAAGGFEVRAKPNWSKSTGVPHCHEACPHHDGKRCRLLGWQPDAICEPVVAGMAEMLSRGPKL